MTRRMKLGVVLMALSASVVVAGAGLTVWSLTHSVAQFADFLRGEVTAEMIKQQVDLITRHMALAWIYVVAGLALGLALGVSGLVVFLTAPRGPPPLPAQAVGAKE